MTADGFQEPFMLANQVAASGRHQPALQHGLINWVSRVTWESAPPMGNLQRTA